MYSISLSKCHLPPDVSLADCILADAYCKEQEEIECRVAWPTGLSRGEYLPRRGPRGYFNVCWAQHKNPLA